MNAQNDPMLEQRLMAMGRLASGITHDLNNTLAAILGYAEFLCEDLEEDTSQHRYAKRIVQATMDIQKQVQQIKAFTRTQAAEKEAIDLRIPVGLALVMLRAGFPKQIEIQERLPDQPVMVSGIGALLTQAIVELVMNAREAMGDRPGKIMLKLESGDFTALGHGRTLTGAEIGNLPVRLTIEDEAGGVPAELFPIIGTEGMTTRPDHKGRGLSLAANVAKTHGGRLTLVNRPGQGLLASIDMPIETVVGAATGKKQVAPKRLVTAPNACILVVNDRPDNRSMMLEQLLRQGYKASAVSTGREALTLIGQNDPPIRLIVTDYGLTDMTGLQLADQVQEMKDPVPLILISGYTDTQVLNAAREHPGVRAVLNKPLDQATFMRVIEGELVA